MAGSGTYNEAEGKEWAALDNVGCHVSAMVALTHHSLIPRNLTAEGVLTAYEEEEHGEWTADVVGGACEGRRDLLEQVDLSFEQVLVGNSSCRPGRDESVGLDTAYCNATLVRTPFKELRVQLHRTRCQNEVRSGDHWAKLL
ncbi:hypothetical protein E5D57_000373 [Metarhizium anisopliae]|nr:hypothetical protein E5D57_000373 [Metarhizium anisopliae]